MEKAKEVEDRIKQQYAESQHREKILVRRLAAKEQEIQDYVVSSILLCLKNCVNNYLGNTKYVKMIVNSTLEIKNLNLNKQHGS